MYRSIRCLFLGKPFSHVFEGSMERAHGTWMLCPKTEHTEKRMLLCSLGCQITIKAWYAMHQHGLLSSQPKPHPPHWFSCKYDAHNAWCIILIKYGCIYHSLWMS